MTPQEKENIHIRLRDALEEEKISQRMAQDHLGINQGYVSMIKLGNNLKAVPDKIWEKIRPWYESKKPITTFREGFFMYKGMPVDTKNLQAFLDKAEEDLEQAQKKEDAKTVREPLKIDITTVGDFIDNAQKDLDQAEIKHKLDEEQKKWEEPNIPTFKEIEKKFEEEKAVSEQPPILVNDDRDDLRLALRTIGSVIRSADGTEFYFLPLWFKMNGDQPMEIMGLDKLPWEVRMILKTMNPV